MLVTEWSLKSLLALRETFSSENKIMQHKKKNRDVY